MGHAARRDYLRQPCSGSGHRRPNAKDPDALCGVLCARAGWACPIATITSSPSFAPSRRPSLPGLCRPDAEAGRLGGPARPTAAAVVDFETRIAQAQLDPAPSSRDPRPQSTTPMSVDPAGQGRGAGLRLAHPAWRSGRASAGRDRRVVLAQNTAVPKIDRGLCGDTPVPTLQAWQAFGMWSTTASPVLLRALRPGPVRVPQQDRCQGQPEQQPRWKRAVAATNRAHGRGAGQDLRGQGLLHAPGQGARCWTLVGNHQDGVRRPAWRRSSWMSAADQGRGARRSSAQFNVKIAYPNTWRDYSALRGQDRTTCTATWSTGRGVRVDDATCNRLERPGRQAPSGA